MLSTICSPRCETLITASRHPARESRSRCQAISGLPPTLTSAFGSRSVIEKRQRLGNAARGLEWRCLARIGHLQAEAASVADAVDDLFAEMRNVDHRLAAPGAREPLEMPGNQRLAADAHQRLRQPIGD